MSSSEHTVPVHFESPAALLVGPGDTREGMDVSARRQAALVAFGRRTNARPRLAVLLQDAVALVAEILRTEFGGVAEMVGGGTRLALTVTAIEGHGQTTDALRHESPLGNRSLLVEDSMAAYALNIASPVITSDLAAEKRFADLFLRKLGIRSALSIPLHLNTEPFGALGVYTGKERTFTADDVGFAETIAHLLTSSIARVKAEEALSEERALSSAVLGMVDALVMTLDVQGHVLSLNGACQRTSGFSLEEVRGKPFCNIFAVPEQVQQVEAMLRRTIAGKAECNLESDLPTKDGSRRHVSWSFRPLCDDNGSVHCVVLSGSDCTERLEALQQFDQANSVAAPAELSVRELRELQMDVADLGTESPAVRSEGPAVESCPPRQEIGAYQPFQPLAGKGGEEQRSSQRRAYQFRQMIAPLVDGVMPVQREFSEVPCEDISAGGISFYLPAAPNFKNLVVALGKPPLLAYFTAEVVRVMEKTIDGRRVHLVGCRFIGRIPSAAIRSPRLPRQGYEWIEP